VDVLILMKPEKSVNLSFIIPDSEPVRNFYETIILDLPSFVFSIIA